MDVGGPLTPSETGTSGPAVRYACDVELSPDSVQARCIRLVGEGKHVLELGSGSGSMTRVLAQHGCQVVCVEIDADAAGVAGRWAERVIVADLDDRALLHQLGDDTFDVILASDVLEHVKEPNEVLRALRDRLRPEGYVVAAIPNVAHASVRLALLQGRFAYTDVGLLDRTHLRFFTRETIEDLFEECGFVIATLDRTFVAPEAGAVAFDPSGVQTEVLATLEQDVDARTYYYLLTAFRASSRAARLVRERVGNLERAERAANALNVALGKRVAELEAASDLAATRLEDKERHIANIEAMLSAAQEATRVSTERLAHLESETLALRVNCDELRLRAVEITRVIGDKDQHIRNLEAILAPLKHAKTRGSLPWASALLKNSFLFNHAAVADSTPAVTRNADQFATFRPELLPLISVVMPVRNVAVSILEATIESIRQQTYPRWELCLVDDGSTDLLLTQYLRELVGTDARFKLALLDQRQGISGATNAALELAEGEFIAFVDHDDLLHPDALAAVADVIRREPSVDLIYTDEDKIGLDGRHEDPYFKPDWAPDLLLANMYIGHLLVIRRHEIVEAGGLRSEFDGSQDYDLVLRVLEHTTRVQHIPRVLYHWRRVPGSTADNYQRKPYAHAAARRALVEAVARRGLTASVEDGMDVSSFRVRYELPTRARVSVIIPTRDRVDLLRTCISSIQRTVDLDRVELVIVNNASVEPETYAYLRDLSSRPYVQVLDYHAPFNYSKINNFGVRSATGDYLLFLNNDTEAEATGWLEALLEHAQRPDVGAVGCRLLYPGRQRRVQHAGVILGMGGVAGHAHKRRRSAESTFYGPNRITNYSAVTAACLMMRRSVFELVGGFDEELAVAFNDIDLCLRVGQRGFRVVYTPFATLVHHESISVGRPEDGRSMDEFEIQRMHARWGPLLRADPYYNPNLPLDQEDFVSAVANQYSPGSSASGIRRIGARTSNPLWALPGIAVHVLWYEGPKGLARETVRYVKERV